MGIQKFTWHFVKCDRCGYTPHLWGNPLNGGHMAAFETHEQAEKWLQEHWLRVGDEWYCPRCAIETHGGMA